MGTELRHLMASTVETARLHAGVSLVQLAELAGLSPRRVHDLLDGRVEFTMVDLARIAAALDIPVTDLLPFSTTADP
ncbi:helix-turn-helix domain-containing protein [Microbacterium paraoxydans]|uniref:helix-turn-helix domain-containing protein n=1 Tax=Microbacterium paraoxydans TaxID=199592 RepID=UPI003D736750